MVVIGILLEEPWSNSSASGNCREIARFGACVQPAAGLLARWSDKL
jgi:hypothetical protein